MGCDDDQRVDWMRVSGSVDDHDDDDHDDHDPGSLTCLKTYANPSW